MIKKKILIATGGTGGHVIPACALANFLIKQNFSVKLTIDKRGQKYLGNDKNFDLVKISSSPLIKTNTFKFFNSILINFVSIMPYADIKYTSDIQIDLKTLMSDIDEIILGLDPTSGECKGRAQRVDDFHHSHINIEIRLFATKNRNIDLFSKFIKITVTRFFYCFF